MVGCCCTDTSMLVQADIVKLTAATARAIRTRHPRVLTVRTCVFNQDTNHSVLTQNAWPCFVGCAHRKCLHFGLDLARCAATAALSDAIFLIRYHGAALHLSCVGFRCCLLSLSQRNPATHDTHHYLGNKCGVISPRSNLTCLITCLSSHF